MEKNREGDPCGFFNIHSVAKLEKGTFWGNFVSGKKRNGEKTIRGTLRSRPVLYVMRKKGETFLVQFPGPTGTKQTFAQKP